MLSKGEYIKLKADIRVDTKKKVRKKKKKKKEKQINTTLTT